jgi:hypothetical protein
LLDTSARSGIIGDIRLLDRQNYWSTIMRRLISFSLVMGLAASATGCGRGDGLLRTRGRVVKGGENFVPEEDEAIGLTFVPITPDGKPPKQFYIVMVDQDTGTFRPYGTQGGGVPPGKYRVAVRLMKDKKDVYNDKFNEKDSPYIFDVEPDSDEIVIDLDDPPTG